MNAPNLKLEIISVGTEVLMGNVLNTNSFYLASRCSKMGYIINHHQTVGDNPERLLESLKLALSRSDVVITTGGLGPTGDDITKEIASKVFDVNLSPSDEVRAHIDEIFKNTGRKCSVDAEYKTALIPDGSKIIQNNNGTAPGIIMQKNNKTLILLPGPPIEIESIYNNGLKDFLIDLSKTQLTSITLKLVDIGETVAADKIKNLIDNQTNPTIAPYAKTGEVHFRVTYSGSDLSKLYKVVDDIKDILGEYVYTEDEDKNLENVLYDLLIDNNYKIAMAESCTGGMAASMFTSISGASKCFNGSFVTYTNEMKHNILGVSKETLDKYSAISKECAVEMAQNALKLTKSDIAISITGNAGPSTSEGKELGLVYVAVATKDKTISIESHFSGLRDKIRLSAAKCAFNAARKVLLGKL